ncbi:hypothetical protein GCK32_009091 [Trichostrongylus colubriformis]|uniref:DNA2/NAM7 helicase helicase domain-containing protein n=1 Tax=Trichostrongylus colubriformis TaxID=6319 RepID=A0AAN8FJE4_TRICO
MHVSLDARKELRSHMADIPYIPPGPRTPFEVRRAPQEFKERLLDKQRTFTKFSREPGASMAFLNDLYSTTCGVIAACLRQATDKTIYSVVWTTPDVNSYPALVSFVIPVPEKNGWAANNNFKGFYDVDSFRGQILSVSQTERTLTVSAVLSKWDSLRWRSYIIRSPQQQLAVGTHLTGEDEKASPTLALFENYFLSTSFSRHSIGWASAGALLADKVKLVGMDINPLGPLMVQTDKGTATLNQDQTHAVHLFRARFPIAVIDSAYGAGKTLCTAVMARIAAAAKKTVLITSIHNSAVDVIAEKLARMDSKEVRPLRYVSERVLADTSRMARYDLANLMEQLADTSADQLTEEELQLFRDFAASREYLRQFAFTGTGSEEMRVEHKELLLVESTIARRLKRLIDIFLRVYNPNVILCTISSALNTTQPKGLFVNIYGSWDTAIVDEASMLPEAVTVALLARFQNAAFTLIGDSKQLPPYTLRTKGKTPLPAQSK